MAWNEARIQLDSTGVGNGNIVMPATSIVLGVAIEIQAALTSGASDIVISHLLPNNRAAPIPILTLTNVTLPYRIVGPQDVPVNSLNVAQSNYVYQGVQSLNVSIVQGVANGLASVWILLSD